MTDEQLREWLSDRFSFVLLHSQEPQPFRWEANNDGITIWSYPGRYEILVEDLCDLGRNIKVETAAQAKDKILKLEEVQKLLGEVFDR